MMNETITKASQPPIAFLRCCALQRPMRAAMFFLHCVLAPGEEGSLLGSLRADAPPARGLARVLARAVTPEPRYG